MTFLLDTNIASAYLRRRSSLGHRFIQYGGTLAIPTIVLGELHAWGNGLIDPAARRAAIREFCETVEILNFGPDDAEVYGVLKASLARRGLTIDTPDLIIASVALAHDLTLVTHNVRHFQRVPGLRIEDWLDP